MGVTSLHDGRMWCIMSLTHYSQIIDVLLLYKKGFREIMKKILFVASEGVPFIKTGGLADVVGSLPKYYDKRYFDARIILPKYMCMSNEMKSKMKK